MSLSPLLSTALQGNPGAMPPQGQVGFPPQPGMGGYPLLPPQMMGGQPGAPAPGMGGGLPTLQPQQMGVPHMLAPMGGGGNPAPQAAPPPQPMGGANPAAQPMGGVGAVNRLQHMYPGSQRTNWSDSPLARALMGRQVAPGQTPYQFGGPLGGQIAGGVRAGTHGLLDMGRAILGANGAQP